MFGFNILENLEKRKMEIMPHELLFDVINLYVVFR